VLHCGDIISYPRENQTLNYPVIYFSSQSWFCHRGRPGVSWPGYQGSSRPRTPCSAADVQVWLGSFNRPRRQLRRKSFGEFWSHAACEVRRCEVLQCILYFLGRTIKNVDVDEVNVSTQQRKGFFFLFHGMPQQGVFHFTCIALEVRCWFWCRTKNRTSQLKTPGTNYVWWPLKAWIKKKMQRLPGLFLCPSPCSWDKGWLRVK